MIFDSTTYELAGDIINYSSIMLLLICGVYLVKLKSKLPKVYGSIMIGTVFYYIFDIYQRFFEISYLFGLIRSVVMITIFSMGIFFFIMLFFDKKAYYQRIMRINSAFWAFFILFMIFKSRNIVDIDRITNNIGFSYYYPLLFLSMIKFFIMMRKNQKLRLKASSETKSLSYLYIGWIFAIIAPFTWFFLPIIGDLSLICSNILIFCGFVRTEDHHFFDELKNNQTIEEALKESEIRYRNLIEQDVVSIIICDLKSLKFLNLAFSSLTEYSYQELLDSEINFIEELIYEPDQSKLKQYFKSLGKDNNNLKNSVEIRIFTKSKEIIWVKVVSTIVRIDKKEYYQCLLIDINEEKIKEDKLKKIETIRIKEMIRAEKMKSISLLAGGIAHDFNNLLTHVLGYLELLELKLEDDNISIEYLGNIKTAILNARDLVLQLLTFAKGESFVKTNLSIDKVIQESANFILRGSKTQYKINSCGENYTIINSGQIDQVFNNILINADQAMPNGGNIIINISKIEINHNTIFETGELKAGEYIKIDIIDEGIGISEENAPYIFDLYFTTKETGSGFGLPTSLEIIKNHGGLLTFESKLNIGTTFSIYLPANNQEPKEKITKKIDISNKKGKILLMDDEDQILDVLKRLIEISGNFVITTTKNGKECIKTYQNARKMKKPFDLVIMDLTIKGGMGGKETIEKLREIDNSVKVVVSSGYSKDVLIENYKDYGFCDCLNKPYTLEQVKALLKRQI